LLLLATSRLATAPALEGDVRRIDLASLSPEETHALVALLAEGRATDPAAIAREAGGHPLFIQELVRHAALSGGLGPTLVRLDEPVRKRLHGRLAEALGGTGAVTVDPNALVRHLEAAGEPVRAARAAEQAARLATDAMAFERAAELYRVALRLGDPAPERRR